MGMEHLCKCCGSRIGLNQYSSSGGYCNTCKFVARKELDAANELLKDVRNYACTQLEKIKLLEAKVRQLECGMAFRQAMNSNPYAAKGHLWRAACGCEWCRSEALVNTCDCRGKS